MHIPWRIYHSSWVVVLLSSCSYGGHQRLVRSFASQSCTLLTWDCGHRKWFSNKHNDINHFISLYGVFLPWVPPQVDEDWLVSTVHLIMGGHIGYHLTRTEVCPLESMSYVKNQVNFIVEVSTIVLLTIVLTPICPPAPSLQGQKVTTVPVTNAKNYFSK